MSDKIRVVIADDHMLLLAGLKMTIESWDEYQVVGTAQNGSELVELCETLQPELVLTDMQMPKMTGTEATAIISRSSLTPRWWR